MFNAQNKSEADGDGITVPDNDVEDDPSVVRVPNAAGSNEVGGLPARLDNNARPYKA